MYGCEKHTSARSASPSKISGLELLSNGRVAGRLGGLALGAGLLLLWTACTPESIDLTLNATLDDVQLGRGAGAGADETDARDVTPPTLADRPAGGGSGPRPGGNISDGTSNTINLPETEDGPGEDLGSAADDDTISPERPGANENANDAGGSGNQGGADAGGTGNEDNDNAGQPETPGDSADDAEVIRVLTQEFSNKFFEFGRSSGNSDNDAFVTGTNQLTLCATGRFFLREQFSFSGDVNFIPDPDDSIGTWAIVIRADGVPAVELRIEQTTATSQAPVLQFELGVDNAGNLFMNGARVFTIEDATGNCQP